MFDSLPPDTDLNGRTDFSIEALQNLLKQIANEYAFSKQDMDTFCSWLRVKSGMDKVNDLWSMELNFSISSKLILSYEDTRDSEELFDRAIRTSFRICDTALLMIEPPTNIDTFIKNSEELEGK